MSHKNVTCEANLAIRLIGKDFPWPMMFQPKIAMQTFRIVFLACPLLASSAIDRV